MTTTSTIAIKRADNPALSSGTSFHGHVFRATPQQLIDLFGPAHYSSNDGEDKTNFDWTMLLGGEVPFTIYDWKEYRKLKMNEKVEWHIGAKDPYIAGLALSEIIKLV